MAREPLRILLSVRNRFVEEARTALGACLKAEAEAAARIVSLDNALQRNRETRGTWQDARYFLEMSANRLEVLRAERRSAVEVLAAAAALSLEARGVVTAARTAAEVVEQLIDEREAASRIEGAKREQHVLDDIARARSAARQRGDTR